MSTHLAKEPSSQELDTAAEVLKLLADRTRLHIVVALLHGEHSVGELAEHVGVNPPTVSQHLAKLRLARLVRTRRAGNHIFYSSANDDTLRLVAQALFPAEHLTSDAEHHHRTANRAS